MSEDISISFVGPDQALALGAANRAQAALTALQPIVTDVGLGASSSLLAVAAALAANTIQPVAASIAAVGTVAGSIGSVVTVAGSIATVGTVSANMANINAISADLALGATSLLRTSLANATAAAASAATFGYATSSTANIADPSAFTANMAIVPAGTTYAATGQTLSGYIPVQPNTVYSTNGTNIVEFNASHVPTPNPNTGWLKTSATAAFVRASWINANVTIFEVRQGTQKTPIAFAAAVASPSLTTKPTGQAKAELFETSTGLLRSTLQATARNLQDFLTHASPNLADPNAFTLNATLDYSLRGCVPSTTNFVTDFINVTPGQTISATRTDVVFGYDATGAPTGIITNTGASTNPPTPTIAPFVVPAGVTQVRLAANASAYLTSFMVAVGSGLPTFQPYDQWSINPKIALPGTKRFLGAKLGCLGDSIMAGAYSDPISGQTVIGYPATFSADHGFAAVQNLAVPGSTVIPRSGRTDSLLELYPNLDNACDVVVVQGGTNDLSDTLGTFGDTITTTFFGAYAALLDGLINKFPTATLLCMTPIPKNVGASTCETFVDAIIQVANSRGIPVIDLFHGSQLRPAQGTTATQNANIARNYIDTGLHPSNLGFKICAGQASKWLGTVSSAYVVPGS